MLKQVKKPPNSASSIGYANSAVYSKNKGANEKVKDRLAKFGVEGIIETRKEALETALNEID